jgi:DNA invertase Pin-like site-specific DNA recombinase
MPPAVAEIPVAQYVRMSTDDQQFSIANQQGTIRRYAVQNRFRIVKTYADPGRSGVVIRRRPGLKSLLADVVSGRADYKAILVYDVSRWGRFQDTDEAAHYEFLCKQAGIPVHYCAETFPNDGTVSSSILKALKRTMAGEYSRELGVKVYEGKKRIVLCGFRVGGNAGCGFRRMLISRGGIPKQILETGEYKALQDDRVVLVVGPREEIRLVRQMFRMALKYHMGPSAIAHELNRQKRLRPGGRAWTCSNVFRLLTNPKYCGCNVWGRTTQRVRSDPHRVQTDSWTTSPIPFPAIVSRKTYDGVQRFFCYPIRTKD